MKKSIFVLLALILLCFAVPAGAELRVQSDREQLAIDETLTLTITKDGRGAIDDAVLQPLANDFQVLGRSQSSSTQIVNGSISSSSTITLELLPKRTGTLMIPALVVGSETSRPLAIRVDSQAAPKTQADNAAIFVETEVDTHTVAIQEQVRYSVRIFWAVEARIGEPEAPQLRDALLEKAGDASYTKTIRGRTYKVFERRFAIFPQKSGVLEIPAPLVQAVVAGRQRPDMFSGFFTQTGEEIRLRGNSERITVREKAPGYPPGVAWLPTSRLSVTADWSSDPTKLKVGEPVTLTIGLAAQGLLGTQLPEVVFPAVDGAKLYQDKAQVENLNQDGGITGLRKESIALVPTRPGSLHLPEVRIPWWDKGRRQVAYAMVPARNLEVSGSPVAAPPAGVGTSALPSATPANPMSAGPELPPSVPATPSRLPMLLLTGAGLLIAGGWLFTLYLLIQARRQLVAQREARQQSDAAQSLQEREGFASLARACRDNDPKLARAALLAWVKIRYPGQTSGSAADLERLFPGSGLAGQLTEIDRALYGHGAGRWQGEGLRAAVEQLRKAGSVSGPRESALPPLYR